MFIRDNGTIEARDGPYPGKITKDCPLCDADELDSVAKHLSECPER